MEKKSVELKGSVVLPITIGKGAMVVSSGKVYHTSRVVAVHEYTNERIRFETLNTHYNIYVPPFPFAVMSPLIVSQAA